MIVNLNNRIRVVLNYFGISELKKARPNSWMIGLEGNVLTIQMYDFMNIFGEHMWMGNSNVPFENFNIEIFEKLL